MTFATGRGPHAGSRQEGYIILILWVYVCISLSIFALFFCIITFLYFLQVHGMLKIYLFFGHAACMQGLISLTRNQTLIHLSRSLES